MNLTPEKHAANIANAQHSSGPRTPEGKAVSARNAVTHGLTAQNLVARTEDEKLEFALIREQAWAECRPVGHTEVLLVDRLVHARCSLVRVTRLLGELETGTTDDVLDPEYAKPLARLNRYYAMHERSEARALRALKLEQTNRALRDRLLNATSPDPLPPLADVAKVFRLRRPAPTPPAAPQAAVNPRQHPSQ